MFWKKSEEIEIPGEFHELIDNLEDKRVAYGSLFLFGGINALIWLAVLIFPAPIGEAFSLIGEVSNKLQAAVLGFPWGAGMMAAYSIFRILLPGISEQKLDSEIMVGYAYQGDSSKRYLIWIASIIFGVINTIMLIFLNLYLTEGL